MHGGGIFSSESVQYVNVPEELPGRPWEPRSGERFFRSLMFDEREPSIDVNGGGLDEEEPAPVRAILREATIIGLLNSPGGGRMSINDERTRRLADLLQKHYGGTRQDRRGPNVGMPRAH